ARDGPPDVVPRGPLSLADAGFPETNVVCRLHLCRLLQRRDPFLEVGPADTKITVGQLEAPRRPSLGPPVVEGRSRDAQLGADVGDRHVPAWRSVPRSPVDWCAAWSRHRLPVPHAARAPAAGGS